MRIEKAHAAGTTNSTSNPGQVQTRSDGDILYLDTVTNGSSNNSEATTAPTTTTFNFSISQISAPQGFVQDFGSYLSSMLNLVMVICLLLVFYNFLQAGLQWITSGGDKGKTEEARNRITHAFIGIIIVSASFATAAFVAYILGLGSIEEILTTIPQLNTI